MGAEEKNARWMHPKHSQQRTIAVIFVEDSAIIAQWFDLEPMAAKFSNSHLNDKFD